MLLFVLTYCIYFLLKFQVPKPQGFWHGSQVGLFAPREREQLRESLCMYYGLGIGSHDMITVTPLLPAVPVPHLKFSTLYASIHGVLPVVSGNKTFLQSLLSYGSCDLGVRARCPSISSLSVAWQPWRSTSVGASCQCFTVRPLLTTSFVIVWLG